MRALIVAVLVCMLMIGVFSYQSEITSTGEKVEIRENYNIILESKSSWGMVQIDPYLYIGESDTYMRIYNPESEVVYETSIKQGDLFEKVLHFDAIKGPWVIELSTDQALLTYESTLKTLYLTSFKVMNPVKYEIFRLLALFMVVFSVLAFCPIRSILRCKTVIERDHDADGLIELSKKLQCPYLRERVRNLYSMNIAVGHIYNGDYHEAKKVLEAIPKDKEGEVKVVKKWLKLYYIYYIGLLLELGQVADAELLMQDKKALLEREMAHKRDRFLTSFLKAICEMHRANYKKAKDQLIALRNLAVSDYEKASVHYGLASVSYQLKDTVSALDYLKEARETAYFKGIQEKIEDLEEKLI